MDNQHLPAIFRCMEGRQQYVSIERTKKRAMSRRQFGGMLAAVSYASIVPAGTAMASALVPPNELSLEDSLQSVLRSIGSDACVAAAGRLAQRSVGSEKLTLHLRNAGIVEVGAT